MAQFVGPGGLPGVAVGVMKEGRVVFTHVAGVRKRGDPTPVGEGDAFHIGSDTKAMTALLAATFVDEGRIRWDSTVAELLGSEVAYRPDYANVTLAQLLSHESGVRGELPGATWSSFFGSTATVAAERKRMVEAALALPSASAPGSAFLYSNFNYVTVGLALEVLSGQGWEALMQDRLFTPLGMTSAGFGAPATPGTVDAPWGHAPDPIPPGPYADNPPALGPAGTVHASLADMLRYAGLYLSGGHAPDGSVLVSEASLAQIEAGRVGDYGFGWLVGHTPQGDLVLGHDGSNTMFYCSLIILPTKGEVVLAMTNAGTPPAPERVGQLMTYLVQHFDL